MQKHPVVTLASVVHSQFVTITAAEHIEARGRGRGRQPARWLLRLATMNDPDVEDITLCISDKRAREAGLVIAN